MVVCTDLGALEGDVVCFGGPYSNLQALQALLAEADRMGVPPEQRICTGDIVAYCADARAAVDLFRKSGAISIRGNCEIQVGAGAPDCGCGFDAEMACDVLARDWFAHVDRTVSADHRAWMRSLPDWITFRHRGKRYALVHGGARDVSRFLWPLGGAREFALEIDAIQCRVGSVDAVIAGHCGIGFARNVNGVEWINAGAIGMPANNGSRRTEFVVLGADGPVFHALDYDCESAARAMERAGLDQGYETALRSGFWPSEDVLPPEMRRESLSSGR
ncbi:MAG: metallophosphoesterase family protein [Paracoccaceae bacterium]